MHDAVHEAFWECLADVFRDEGAAEVNLCAGLILFKQLRTAAVGADASQHGVHTQNSASAGLQLVGVLLGGQLFLRVGRGVERASPSTPLPTRRKS